MSEAPPIDTERLEMRGHVLADFAECAALWADPIVVRYIGGRPFTEEECWARLLRYVGHWSVLGFGYWVVREKGSRRFVGEVGFADFMRDMTPSIKGCAEAGWVLSPWAHGKGFATEAVRAATEWLDARFAAMRNVCMIDLGNAASIHVAKKCGYEEWTRTDFKGTPVTLFERRSR